MMRTMVLALCIAAIPVMAQRGGGHAGGGGHAMSGGAHFSGGGLRGGPIGGSRVSLAPRRFAFPFARPYGSGLYYGGYYPSYYADSPYVSSDYAAPAPVDSGYNYYPQYAPPPDVPVRYAPSPQPPPTPVTLTRIVFKDHTTQTAVAYSLDRGNLVYINENGFRRSVPLDQVDMEQSRKMNEDRGVTFNPRS
jgi:hypothetical protein